MSNSKVDELCVSARGRLAAPEATVGKPDIDVKLTMDSEWYLVIRADSDKCPEFWTEARIPASSVKKFLGVESK